MTRRAGAVAAAGVLVVVGALLGFAFSGGHAAAGPPPLGNASTFTQGVDCTPGKTLADGFYALENHSGLRVRITGVRLIGGPGQAMTSPAYLTPAGPATNLPLIGLASWPPTSAPEWKHRRLALGATIAPGAWANLVFAQTRTSSDPQPARPVITYTAGGTSYALTETTETIVAVSCGD
jgi:hypothetical protein